MKFCILYIKEVSSMHYRERLREWITDHDLKQKALAKELGITESVVSNYLTGRSQMPKIGRAHV